LIYDEIMNLSRLDIIICGLYIVLVATIGIWVSRNKKGHSRDAKDYFLAGNKLSWYVIGASLIASNISAQQFIGMSGSGFAVGLGIASYEWMSAITLIVVGKYFLPMLLKRQIFTMPQFLERRFDKRVKTGVAIFFLFDHVLIALVTVLYLGALALSTVAGIDLHYAIIGLALFALLICVWGGLEAVVWTEVFQVVILIGGGLLTTYMALDKVSDGHGFFAGLATLYQKAPEKFNMIFDKTNPYYSMLPGISVLIGGMWIANLSYWGCNQYIVQRALAAKNLKEAQRGVLFAGYLKIIIPLIVVVPGICAFVLKANISKPDEAYPWLINSFLGPGIKGIAFAALMAAIISASSSIANASATIFTMDIYKALVKKEVSQKNLVLTGRIVTILVMAIAVCLAPLLRNLGQVFQFIQEFGGFLTPGIVSIFLFGLFWKKASSNSVLWAAVATLPLSLAMKICCGGIPFMDRMGIVFILLSGIIIAISIYEKKGDHPESISPTRELFHTDMVFNVGAIGIFIILSVIYIVFW
jgi:SSS family solute:Na+ symporter